MQLYLVVFAGLGVGGGEVAYLGTWGGVAADQEEECRGQHHGNEEDADDERHHEELVVSIGTQTEHCRQFSLQQSDRVRDKKLGENLNKLRYVQDF